MEISISHNLRTKRDPNTQSNVKATNLSNVENSEEPRPLSQIKKKKLIRDLRIHVTKLSPNDLQAGKSNSINCPNPQDPIKPIDTNESHSLPNPVVIKQKPRRRKTINRTGFPVKKKKKKKIVPSETVIPPVIPTETTPVSIIISFNISN